MTTHSEDDFYQLGQQIGRLSNAFSIMVLALKNQPGFDVSLFEHNIRQAINHLDEEDDLTKTILETVL